MLTAACTGVHLLQRCVMHAYVLAAQGLPCSCVSIAHVLHAGKDAIGKKHVHMHCLLVCMACSLHECFSSCLACACALAMLLAAYVNACGACMVSCSCGLCTCACINASAADMLCCTCSAATRDTARELAQSAEHVVFGALQEDHRQA
jgi:hypothetical protein